MRELIEHVGADLPAMNKAAVLRGVFSAEEIEALHIELSTDLVWAILPSSFVRIDQVAETLNTLEQHELSATSFVIGRLASLVAQTNRTLPLLNCKRTRKSEDPAHRDTDPRFNFLRFVVIETGSVDYLLNRDPSPQHAQPGDVLCNNNLSAFTDTRPWHEVINGTGQRFIADFMAA